MSRRIHAAIEFDADAEPISGRIAGGDVVAPFVGWLELMALLERVLDEGNHGTGDEP
jgi:hypothetical protein